VKYQLQSTRYFTPRAMLLVPIEQEAGEAPEPGGMLRRREKSMPLPGVKF